MHNNKIESAKISKLQYMLVCMHIYIYIYNRGPYKNKHLKRKLQQTINSVILTIAVIAKTHACANTN